MRQFFFLAWNATDDEIQQHRYTQYQTLFVLLGHGTGEEAIA